MSTMLACDLQGIFVAADAVMLSVLCESSSFSRCINVQLPLAANVVRELKNRLTKIGEHVHNARNCNLQGLFDASDAGMLSVLCESSPSLRYTNPHLPLAANVVRKLKNRLTTIGEHVQNARN